jgi:hypothetical protein
MTAKLFNLAQMTTATTGTGTVTLGLPTTNYRSFAAAGAVTGDVVPYAIIDGSASECGVGTLTIAGSVTTMTRTLTGSTTGALLDLSGGAIVSLTPRAEDLTTPTLTAPSWSVVTTAANVAVAVSKTLYNVTGQTTPVTITLPSAPVIGDAVALFMADAVTANTLTVDAGSGRAIRGYGRTHVIATQYAYYVYRCTAALTWVVESDSTTKSIFGSSSNITINQTHLGALTSVDSTGGARTVTIPTNASVPLPIGFQTEVIWTVGTNTVTIVASGGVTIVTGASLTLEHLSSRGLLTKIGTDEWTWNVYGKYPVNLRSDIPNRRIYDSYFQTADGAPWVHGTSAGPMAIQDASGQWWQLDLSKGYAHASWFGAIGDGSTDDVAALNAASTAMSAAGGGAIDCDGGRYLINSADLVIAANARFIGSMRAAHLLNVNPDTSAIKGALILNPTYTVRLAGHGASILGLFIIKTGLTVPTTTRQSLDLVASFSGIAITTGTGTVNSAMSTYVGYCMVLGFNKAYYNNGQARPVVEYLWGDCTNGIELTEIHDWPHGPKFCHFWDFLTFGGGVDTEITSITGAADNGSGLVRITLSSSSIMQTGDSAVVWGIVGTTEANNRWTVTRVDSTHFDLQGTIFTHAYVSGGSFGISAAHRAGKAYYFHDAVDSGGCVDCKSFGYLFGEHYLNTGPVQSINPQHDDYSTIKDPTRYGVAVQSSVPYGASVIGGWISSKAVNVLANGDCQIMGTHSVNAVTYLLWASSGKVSTDGFYATGTGSVRIANGTTSVSMIGGDLTGITVTIESAAQNSTTLCGVIGHSNILAPITTVISDAADTDTTTVAYAGTAGHRRLRRFARGSNAAPTVSIIGDVLSDDVSSGYDGAAYQFGSWIKSTVDTSPSSGKVPTSIIFANADQSTGSLTTRLTMVSNGTLQPGADNTQQLGASGVRWASVWAANGTIQTSDQREKLNVTPSTLGLEFINSLRPVSFNWRVGHNEVVGAAEDGTPITCAKPGNRTHWGLIAQEVKATCNALNVDFGGWVLSDAADPDSQQALRYDQFVAPLIKAVQELTARIVKLEKVVK